MLVKAFTAGELPHLVAGFWAPPPSGTVRAVTGDRCTWALPG